DDDEQRRVRPEAAYVEGTLSLGMVSIASQLQAIRSALGAAPEPAAAQHPAVGALRRDGGD
ncbi:unnamed protein product, partial [Urochloa humidicola]